MYEWDAQHITRVTYCLVSQLSGSEDVGIDLGVTHFAALSNGEFIDHPHYFRKAEKKLAYVHRHKEVQRA